MKRLFILTALFITANAFIAINGSSQNNVNKTVHYNAVAQKPSFQGGDINDFSKWVKANLDYPESAKKNSVEGMVYMSFSVDIDGSVRDVKVTVGIDPDIDREAARVVSSSPKWTPGHDSNGKPICVSCTNFPVSFNLKNVNNNTSKQNTPKTGQSAKPNITPVVEAFDLHSAFSDNEVAARRKFLNQKYQIKGKIGDFTYIGNTPVVILYYHNWIKNVDVPAIYCHFPIQEEATVAEYHKYQQVTICGVISSYDALGIVHVKNCKFVK